MKKLKIRRIKSKSMFVSSSHRICDYLEVAEVSIIALLRAQVAGVGT